MVTSEYIRDVVAYHAPGSEGLGRIAAMRTATEMFMRSIVENCSGSGLIARRHCATPAKR